MTLHAILLTLALIFLGHAGLRAQEGALDPSFAPNDIGHGSGDGATSVVREVTQQADGKILIGGDFNKYNAAGRSRIARLTADGRIDPTFAPDPGVGPTTGTNSRVRAIAIQSDGKIIIGGKFTTYNNSSRNGLARLNANGSLDGGFVVGSGIGSSEVTDVLLQPDGKVLIAGNFLSYNGTPRMSIARLNTDGTLDSSFDPGTGPSTTVVAMALQEDGRILIAGGFTSYNGTAINRIARLEANGTLDTTFDPGTGPNSGPAAITLQQDGKILIGGSFTTYNGTQCPRVARLLSDGTRDTGFNPGTGADATVLAITLQPDGKILLGGFFASFNGTAQGHITRLEQSGAQDMGFSSGAGANSTVYVLCAIAGGRTVVAGAFNAFDGSVTNYITAVGPDGAVAPGFNAGTGASGYINHETGLICNIGPLAVQPDGKIIIGGNFLAYDGTIRQQIARVDPNGSLDASFDPGNGPIGISAHVGAVAVQPDGKILVGGKFTSFGTTLRQGLARLNTNGTLDGSFSSGFTGDDDIRAIALQPDGKVLVGGVFSSHSGNNRKGILRLNANGTLDASFTPGTGLSIVSSSGGSTYAIAVQPDGKILIGGYFTSYNGVTRNYIARLNADGSLDTGYSTGTGASSGVSGIALQPDGKALVSGYFTSYNGVPRNHVLRLNTDGTLDTTFDPGTGANDNAYDIALQPDGRVLISGVFTSVNGTSRSRVARLNANGGLDLSFDAGAIDAWVSTVLVAPDGRVIIGGGFVSVAGTGKNRLAVFLGTARMPIKALLEGPYNGASMSDALRTLPSFPLTEPFTSLGYTATAYSPGATIPASVLATTGNDAIVDWIIAEMRPTAAPNVIAASRAVLLQRDGDVVDLDGRSPIGFAGLAAGSYRVALRHRNHLPVLAAASAAVNYGTSGAAVDFTLPATGVYDNDARKNINGTMVLACGDVTFDGTVKYTGAGNDRDPILVRVGGALPTATLAGYWKEDVNMDGVVKYTGANNDRDPILVNVGGSLPTATRVASLP